MLSFWCHFEKYSLNRLWACCKLGNITFHVIWGPLNTTSTMVCFLHKFPTGAHFWTYAPWLKRQPSHLNLTFHLLSQLYEFHNSTMVKNWIGYTFWELFAGQTLIISRPTFCVFCCVSEIWNMGGANNPHSCAVPHHITRDPPKRVDFTTVSRLHCGMPTAHNRWCSLYAIFW